MEYLFFDIECANCDGGNGKICSFGYVLADGDMNVLKKGDIIINPKAPFRLRGWGNKYYVNLSYTEEEFRKAPDFSFYYGKIKELLTADGRLVFGYAPENDAGFLRSEFERYRLAPIDFEFYDVQRLQKYVFSPDGGNLRSLSGACEDMGIDTSFTEHKSCDDAYASMLVLEKLCDVSGLKPEGLIKKYTPCRGELKNGTITADYFRKKPPLKESERNMLKGPNRDKFRDIVRKSNNTKAHGMLYGKKICFSREYEYRHFSEMCFLVTELGKIGGRYTDKVKRCDIFVKSPEICKGGCQRLKEAEALRESRKNAIPSIMSFDTFLSLLDTDSTALGSVSEN